MCSTDFPWMRIESYLILGTLFCTPYCGPNDAVDEPTEVLRSLVREYRNDIPYDNLKAILVVTEQGCLPCNRAFANMLEEHLKDPHALFWVSAMGVGVDISPFRSLPDRVVWDYDDRLKASGILKGSGAIILQQGRIDTIIHIQSWNIDEALAQVGEVFQPVKSDTLDGTARR